MLMLSPFMQVIKNWRLGSEWGHTKLSPHYVLITRWYAAMLCFYWDQVEAQSTDQLNLYCIHQMRLMSDYRQKDSSWLCKTMPDLPSTHQTQYKEWCYVLTESTIFGVGGPHVPPGPDVPRHMVLGLAVPPLDVWSWDPKSQDVPPMLSTRGTFPVMGS